MISLRSQGVPVDGIGIHAVFEEAPNGPLIVDRLNWLAEAGVPIWITGYSFAHPDEVERAVALDDFLMAVTRWVCQQVYVCICICLSICRYIYICVVI